MFANQINTIITAAKSSTNVSELKAMLVKLAKSIKSQPHAGKLTIKTNKGDAVIDGLLLGYFGLAHCKSGYKLTVVETGLGVGLPCSKTDSVYMLKLADAIADTNTMVDTAPLLLLLTSIFNRVKDNGDYVGYL